MMPTGDHDSSDRSSQGVPQGVSALALMHPLRILAPSVGVALLVWGLLFAHLSSPAWASPITVKSLADDPDRTDAECTLREEITAANTDAGGSR
jgi:CSLREA domain-containing protein